MGGMCSVGGSVVDHRIQSGSYRFQSYHAREDCAITNFSIDKKSGALCYLERLPIRRALTDPFLDFRRLGTLQQFPFRNSSRDRKSTRLNSSHTVISYAVF